MSYNLRHEQRLAVLNDVMASIRGCDAFESGLRKVSGVRWRETAEERERRIRMEVLTDRVNSFSYRRHA